LELNRVEIDGRVIVNDGLRRTPAGLPSLLLRIEHESGQREAGHDRRVLCELEGIAFGDPATKMTGLREGDTVRLTGFLERKSLRDPRPILHVTAHELI
jgi:primosomal replication protein N